MIPAARPYSSSVWDRAIPIGDAGDLLANLESPNDLEDLWEREWRDAVFRQCLLDAVRTAESGGIARRAGVAGYRRFDAHIVGLCAGRVRSILGESLLN